jgi:hypothetical protein
MIFFMSATIITISSAIIFFIGLTMYIRTSHHSKRFKQNKKKMYHWDGKGYYQKILKKL